MIPIANPVVSAEAKERVERVLDLGMIAAGDVVREFEDAFADYVGTDHAVATASGTAALHVMFEATGVGSGDAVVTTPFSFISSANAVKHAGATPTFADVNRETYNLDPDRVEAVLADRDDVAALLPVHLYGLPAAMDEFRRIADDHDLLLLEDAAQAHGATHEGRPVGSIGDAAAFSFYPTKNMTTGEGGMVTTDDDAVAERARRLVNHGRTGAYEHSEVGYNYRMTNVAAALGLDQLERLPDWVATRRRNARLLTEGLSDVPGLTTPTVPTDREHAYHQYTVRTGQRDRLQAALDDAEVGYGVYYPKTIPDQPAYDHRDASPPVARELADEVLSLPVHPRVSKSDISRIVEVVTDVGLA